MPTVPTRALKIVGKIASALVLLFLAAEVSFRLAGAISSEERGDQGLTSDHIVVLCVGDSHTWGLGRGYPARLAERLGARSSRYRVINLGVPGTNTAQLRRRFISYLDRYRPRIVVLWAGLNNSWNQTDVELWHGGPLVDDGVRANRSVLSKLLDHSRVVRLVRVWRREAELNRALAASDPYVVPAAKPGKNIWFESHRSLFGDDDYFRNEGGGKVPPDELTRVTEGDIRWMIEEAGKRNIPLVTIQYAIGEASVLAVNRGIEAAVEGTPAMLVPSIDAVRQLEAQYDARGEGRPELFDKTAHPTQEQYDVIGDLVMEQLDEHHALPADEGRQPISILPLGDSITEKWGKVSYRYWLWRGLHDAGWTDVDFVGTQRDPWASEFDGDHEGHGSWSAQELWRGHPDHPADGKVETWTAGKSPDVALILMGTNDVVRRSCLLAKRSCSAEEQSGEFRRGAAEAAEAITGVIEILRRRNPHVAIVLAELPPTVWVPDAELRRINDEDIAPLAKRLGTKESPVVTVDLQQGLVADPAAADSDTTDGIHPNFNGAQKIAARFQQALTAEILPWVAEQRHAARP